MLFARRKFLTRGMQLLGSALVPSSLLADLLQGGPTAGGALQADDLIWYSSRYLTAEMPMDQLNSCITPTKNFFVRNNLLMPEIDLDRWRLRISGEVEKPLEFTFGDLRQLSTASVANTLECAGNGRAFFDPQIKAVPWRRGGVGNAVFRGPRMRDLLEKAGLKSTARHVAFKGLDVVPAGAQEFIRSIPLDKALDPATLVASDMNDQPLTPAHGFPARALVPGWVGSCSIKWLCEIRVLSEEFNGFYMKSAYRLPPPGSSPRESRTEALKSLIVKSIIAHPAENSTVVLPPSGVITVSGAAWAGERKIKKIEISMDGARAWSPATFDSEKAKYAWRLWKYDWRPRPGAYVIQSRATDDAGHVQPAHPRWNASGYLWNATDRVRVTVQAA